MKASIHLLPIIAMATLLFASSASAQNATSCCAKSTSASEFTYDERPDFTYNLIFDEGDKITAVVNKKNGDLAAKYKGEKNRKTTLDKGADKGYSYLFTEMTDINGNRNFVALDGTFRMSDANADGSITIVPLSGAFVFGGDSGRPVIYKATKIASAPKANNQPTPCACETAQGECRCK